MTKPWQTSAWKELRAAVIKDHCEICSLGKSDGKVLVLHHPAELEEARLVRTVTPAGILADLWWNLGPNDSPELSKEIEHVRNRYRAEVPRPTSANRMVCERGHTHVRLRKDGTWRCYQCQKDIEPPTEVNYVAPNERLRYEKLAYQRFKTDYWGFGVETADRMNQVLREQNEKASAFYLTLEGTVTLCKGCHQATHKGMIRCPQCSGRWMNPSYKQCFDCLPDEKKEEIRELQLFEAEMDARDRALMDALERGEFGDSEFQEDGN